MAISLEKLKAPVMKTPPPLTVSRLPPDCSLRSMNVCRARCCAAFAARTTPHRDWRKPEAEYNTRVELSRQRVKDAIDAELAWLTSKQGEPELPQFPLSPARPPHRFVRLPGTRKKVPAEEPLNRMYALIIRVRH